MSENLATLVDRSAFISAEAQLALEALVGEASWEVDLSDHPTLTWQLADRELQMRPSLLGTVSFASNTWHWGWDNVNDFPAQVVDQASLVRAKGSDLPEVQTAELPLADDDNLPLLLAIAAKTLTGITTHYAASYGPKTDVWFLLEDTGIDLGAPQAERVGRVIAQALATTPVTDQRLALRSWADQRGFQLIDEGDSFTLAASDGQAKVSFAGQQIVDIDVQAAPRSGDAVPAMEPAAGITPPAETKDAPAIITPKDTPKAPEAPAVSDEPAPSEPAAPAAAAEAPAAPAPTAAEPVPTPAQVDAAPGEPAADAATTLEEPPVAPSDVPAAQADEPPVEPAAPAAKREVEEEKPKKKKGFFSRLFGG